MTDTKPTIAQRIIDHTFGGDGASYHTPRNGVDAEEFMNRCAHASYCNGDVLEFRDGSRIEFSGAAFDTPEGWRAAS